MTRPRRSAALLAASVAALALASTVQAKSFDFPQANVDVVVEADGSLRVTEQLTYAFSGPFSGANRDIPLRSGESIDQVSVLENGRAFATGGCVEIGCSSPAGTFGVTRDGDTERVVWHFSAADEVRTFEIRYRMRGCRGGVRRRRRREPPGLGRPVGHLARAFDGDDHRPGRRPAGVGASRLGARRRHDRRAERAPACAERVPAPVRGASHALSAQCIHVDRGHARRERQRARHDRRRGARGREGVRARQGADRRRDRASVADGARPPGVRRAAGARDLVVRLLALRARARDRLRPRVRAGAPDRHRGGARADAPATGRRGGVVRVHCDDLRPDPARSLQGGAGHNRAQRLGRHPAREHRRSGALPR